MLFPGEKVYDATNVHELLGDGTSIVVNGERRLFSRLKPTPAQLTAIKGFAKPFEATFKPIPRSLWPSMIAKQVANRGRVSDTQDFPPHDQDGLPTCWGNGPAHAMTTFRRIMGLPFKMISANSITVPISGGHQGGYEGEWLQYAAKHGACSCDVWPNNDTRQSLMNDPACIADRQNHVALEWFDLGNKFDNYATSALLQFPDACAYDDWSHVVSGSDLVDIHPDWPVDRVGRFGLRKRNNWGNWGANNEHGFPGYVVFAEGAYSHGCPDSGFCMRQATPSMN